MPKYLSTSIVKFFDKTSIKFKYLAIIITFLTSNKVILAFQVECIYIKFKLKKKIYIIKTLIFIFNINSLNIPSN